MKFQMLKYLVILLLILLHTCKEDTLCIQEKFINISFRYCTNQINMIDDVPTHFSLLFLFSTFCPIGRTIGDDVSASTSSIDVSGLDDEEYAPNVEIFVILEKFLVNCSNYFSWSFKSRQTCSKPKSVPSSSFQMAYVLSMTLLFVQPLFFNDTACL